MTKINSNKKGFTIIEVVLVLAIAGLIFMMVFIALPALQRSQRDTQRSNDIARVQTALNNYQANNRGAIPQVSPDAPVSADAPADAGSAKGTYVKGHEKPLGTASSAGKTKTWLYFYDNYLIVNSAGAQDVFADPDGGFYSLWVQTCKSANNKVNEECQNGQRYGVTFDAQAQASLDNENASQATDAETKGEAGHSISILVHATCQGEVAMYSTGSRKVAILYKKEGGGTFCLNN